MATLILTLCVMALVGVLCWREELGFRRLRAERERSDANRQAILELWAHEREALLTRIQAWDPNPAIPEKAPAAPMPQGGSQPAEGVGGLSVVPLTAAELADLRIRSNEDGGFVDLSTGTVFETAEDIQEWRSQLRKQGAPLDVDPREVEADGLAAAIATAARKRNGVSQPKEA